MGNFWEIERKWIVQNWPSVELPLLSEQQMRQGYLQVKPTVRIREEQQTGSEPVYILCLKSSGKLARKEVEIPLRPELFHELETWLSGPLIPKLRRTYLLPDDLHLEVNHVDASAETTFWYAEIEFPSIEKADAWQVPDILQSYLVQEVTGVPGYSMASYWSQTR